MAGEHGPIPKRSTQRRRQNKPEVPVVKAPGRSTRAPTAGKDWHPAARMWFESLAHSGQAVFYQASDWASAWVVAESMSRELNPQPIVVAGAEGEASRVEMHSMPPKGASLSAWLKAMTALMATEGDRRRMRLELDTGPAPTKEVGGVAELDEYRRRVLGTSG